MDKSNKKEEKVPMDLGHSPEEKTPTAEEKSKGKEVVNGDDKGKIQGPTVEEKGKCKAIIQNGKDNEYNNDQFFPGGSESPPSGFSMPLPRGIPGGFGTSRNPNLDSWLGIERLWADKRREMNAAHQAHDGREVRSAINMVYEGPRNNRVSEGRQIAGRMAARGFLHPGSGSTAPTPTSGSQQSQSWNLGLENQIPGPSIRFQSSLRAQAPDFVCQPAAQGSNAQNPADTSANGQISRPNQISEPLNVPSMMSVPANAQSSRPCSGSGSTSGPPPNAPKGPKNWKPDNERPARARACQYAERYHGDAGDHISGPAFSVILYSDDPESLPRHWVQSGERAVNPERHLRPGQHRGYHEPGWKPNGETGSTNNVARGSNVRPGRNFQMNNNGQMGNIFQTTGSIQVTNNHYAEGNSGIGNNIGAGSNVPLTDESLAANNHQLASGSSSRAPSPQSSRKLVTQRSYNGMSPVQLQSPVHGQPPGEARSSVQNRTSTWLPTVRDRNDASPFPGQISREAQSPAPSWPSFSASNSTRPRSPFPGQTSGPTQSSTSSWSSIPPPSTSSSEAYKPRYNTQHQQRASRAASSSDWRKKAEDDKTSEDGKENEEKEDVKGRGKAREQ